jgi:hypothetical protein
MTPGGENTTNRVCPPPFREYTPQPDRRSAYHVIVFLAPRGVRSRVGVGDESGIPGFREDRLGEKASFSSRQLLVCVWGPDQRWTRLSGPLGVSLLLFGVSRSEERRRPPAGRSVSGSSLFFFLSWCFSTVDSRQKGVVLYSGFLFNIFSGVLVGFVFGRRSK